MTTTRSDRTGVKLLLFTLLGVLVALFGACDAGSFLAPSPHEPEDGPATLRVYADLAGQAVTGLSIEVAAVDIDPPVVYNIPIADGAASGTVRVLAGSDRRFTLRAFDAAGIETHRGVDTVDVVAGENPPLEVTMEPLHGEQEISATIGSYAVIVSPAADTVFVGDSIWLEVSVVDSVGVAINDATPYWATRAPELASVNATGLVHGLAPGTADIVATYGSVAGGSRILVRAPVASVTVDPAVDSMGVAGTLQLTATARDGGGTVVPDREVTWASSDPAIADVSHEGLVSASAEGQITVSATAEGVSGTAAITVAGTAEGSLTIATPDTLYGAGDTLTLTVEARDVYGNPIADPDVRWSSQDTSIATVDSMGTVTARALGIAVIAVSSICCASDFEPVVVEDAPKQVTDLTAVGVYVDTIALQWTQVDDGQGSPAAYAIAYGSPTITEEAALENGVILLGSTIGEPISHTFRDLEAATDYQIQVVAFRGTTVENAVAGPGSNIVDTTTAAVFTAGTATATPGDGQVELSAVAPTGGSTPYAYQWHRSQTSGFTPAGGTAVSGLTALTGTDTGLSNGTTYYYRLVATDDAGTSVTYPEASATPNIPVTPGTASATAGNGQVDLSATAASGGVSPYTYQWYRSTASGFTPGAANEAAGLTSLSETDTGLTNGTAYYYRLVVTDDSGTTAQYNEVSATPTAGSSGMEIALTIARLDGGTGNVLVSNGVPLQPGQLMPGDVGEVAVDVEGSEVQAYVEALEGRHSDGSVRFLLLQFSANTDTQSAATLRLGATPAQSRLSKTAIDFTDGATGSNSEHQGFPSAIASPTVDQMLASNIATHPTITAADGSALGGAYATYEADLETWADTHWSTFGTLSTGGEFLTHIYYGRALMHFAWWTRTADPDHFKRACAYAFNYRYFYLEQISSPGPYGTSLHNWMPEDLALHYWLTGDTDSRDGVQTFTGVWKSTFDSNLGDYTTYQGEPRPMARWLITSILMHKLAFTDYDWETLAGGYLDDILNGNGWITSGAYEGAWEYDDQNFPSDPPYVSNYMNAMLADALILYYREIDADSRIPTAVQGILDYLWDTQWLTGDSPPSFQYYNINVSHGDGTSATPGLNGFYAHLFSWYGDVSGAATYTTHGNTIFETHPDAAYLAGEKQFNQAYYKSWAHLGYR